MVKQAGQYGPRTVKVDQEVTTTKQEMSKVKEVLQCSSQSLGLVKGIYMIFVIPW